MFKWLVRHSADIIDRELVGRDGKVPLQRLNNRSPKPIDVEFGEQICAKTPTYKNHRKCSLQERSVAGTWLGIWAKTGESIVAIGLGRVVKVRTVNRRPEAERWYPTVIDFLQSL